MQTTGRDLRGSPGRVNIRQHNRPMKLTAGGGRPQLIAGVSQTGSTMTTTGLTLVIPDKADQERDSVAAAWNAAGGEVLRLGRFWEPPTLEPESTRVYGNDTFCLVLREKLGFQLHSPPDELIASVPRELLGRDLTVDTLDGIKAKTFPCFVKSLVPKQIASRVYFSYDDLASECDGLEGATQLLVSEVVVFEAEFRCFVLNQVVLDVAAYEGEGDLGDVTEFVAALSRRVVLPSAVVVDVGRIGSSYVLIEFNAAWGAGLNGCSAARVLPSIERASAP